MMNLFRICSGKRIAGLAAGVLLAWSSTAAAWAQSSPEDLMARVRSAAAGNRGADGSDAKLRSAVVSEGARMVPLLVSEIEVERKRAVKSTPGAAESLEYLTGLLVSMADEKALVALCRLADADLSRFAPAIGNLLDAAQTKGKAYQLAYRVAGSNQVAVDQQIAKWVARNTRKESNYQALASAMSDAKASGKAKFREDGKDVILAALDAEQLQMLAAVSKRSPKQ